MPVQYRQELIFESLSAKQILVTCTETLDILRWQVDQVNESGFLVGTGTSLTSGEVISATIEDKKLTLTSQCNHLIDNGKNRKNVESFVRIFSQVLEGIPEESVDERFEKLKTAGNWVASIKFPDAKGQGRFTGFLSMLIPRSDYFVTPILVYINVLVFLLMVARGVNVLSPDMQSLIDWGANIRVLTRDGQWWRLITSFFIHIGIVHLLANMFALVEIGSMLEPRIGRGKFLLSYFFCGIAGSVTSMAWHDLTVSAGASGAIFGMFGLFLALLTTSLIPRSTRRDLLLGIVVFVAYNLANGMKGGIDNAAHLGGLVMGIIIGYAYYPSLVEPDEPIRGHKATAFITLFVAAAVFITYRSTNNDLVVYEKRMKEFVSYEQMALDFYRLDDQTSREDRLHEIDSRSLYYWNECRKIMNKVNEMELPDKARENNKLFDEYTTLRIKSFGLIQRGLFEETDKYKDQIKEYDLQIEKLINKLKENNQKNTN